ncbi:MAG: malonyl-ACP O-methyltransferase BioC [Hyphomicrobiales bacterium]
METIDPTIIDTDVVQQSFEKSLHTYHNNAIAQKQIAEQLLRFGNEKRSLADIKTVFEIGCGTGVLTEQLFNYIQPDHFIFNDICNGIDDYIFPIFNKHDVTSYESRIGNIEELDFPHEVDMIVSGSTFQWIEELDALFCKIYNSLKPGGVLLFNTYGPENFREISQLTGNALDYKSRDYLSDMLHKYFDHVAFYEETIELKFPCPKDVFKHLKLTGVNGLKKNFFSKEDYKNIISNYLKLFDGQGCVSLTFHPIYFFIVK